MGIAALGRRLLVVSAVAGLVAATVAAGGGTAGAQPPAEPGASVDSRVLADLADRGTTDFFVYLRDQADLSPAQDIQGKEAKGRFVYETLTAHAETSQAGLVADLTARGVDFTPYWVSNVVFVQGGDRGLLNRLAARSDVMRIEANDTWQIHEPTVGADAGITAIEWGVLNVNANDVWTEFGVTGQGIVVANIDTGVDFDHPALVNQYRGNTGTGFDHDYNWFDPTGTCTTAPCDNNNHGTHTAGTMVGDDGGSNQIGVAPGAKWIAAKGCSSSSCASNTLLASGQWMVAPTEIGGGNPDPSMAPHVVNNSWGGGRGDTWYQATINAWISAGIFPMFSAGNSGPSCSTANSPGDNIPAYAVGAYDINNNIASFSSRGPSGVSASEIKPNIAAPGVNVRSSINGGGYANFNGTSMASPHAAGVLALIWSAAPALAGDISGTKALLDDTARDVAATGCGGTVDDNNIFGEGRIDAHAAVSQVITPGNQPPVADFGAVCNNQTLTCTFDASASFDPDGTITSWDWTFGDGASGSGEVVSHTYAAAGTFTVTLTVTDNEGATDNDSQVVSVGAPPGVVFSDDFESNQGWVTNPDGTDTATTGLWEVADPQPTSSGIPLQLGTTTSGTQDLVTGAIAGANAGVDDIDNGDTTVISPSISLPSGSGYALSFQYYFAHLSNATSADYLRLFVVSGGSASLVFEQLGAPVERAGAWSEANVDLSGFAGQTVALRFEAADASTASLIEAGVDDVLIEEAAPSTVVFSDDFESNQGWVTNPNNNDTATTGLWAVADPQPTSFSGVPLQLDAFAGSQDLVTGPIAGANAGVDDIDNGDTTVISPSISLPSGASIELSFQYYFAHLDNATSADYLRLFVVSGGGATEVFEELGTATDRAAVWTGATIDLSAFAGQTIQLRFEAADAAGGSLIEAAVDDLEIVAQ